MAFAKLKLAYAIFSLSFGTWLALALAVWYPSFASATPTRFPNPFTLTVFMGLAGVAAVSCGIIGVSYLGINIKLEHKKSLQSPKSSNPVLQASPEWVADTPRNSAFAEAGEADLDIYVFLQIEQESNPEKVKAHTQDKQKKLQFKIGSMSRKWKQYSLRNTLLKAKREI
jgi:hypothetical protein